jgi:AcrR family transcriptional regulator
MELKLSIKLNEKLYLRDPESTELGRRIVKQGILMIDELGLEAFTFKKLAEEINTTEASIYRYFENKHRLLLYIVAWYWSYLEYLVMFHLNNLTDVESKIKKVIELLVTVPTASLGAADFDTNAMSSIVISESSKTYLSKDVDSDNSFQLYKPYKDLCARIAELILAYNPKYPYPHSLTSTMIETTHLQQHFMYHLPRLTDFRNSQDEVQVRQFLEHIVFSALK